MSRPLSDSALCNHIYFLLSSPSLKYRSIVFQPSIIFSLFANHCPRPRKDVLDSVETTTQRAVPPFSAPLPRGMHAQNSTPTLWHACIAVPTLQSLRSGLHCIEGGTHPKLSPPIPLCAALHRGTHPKITTPYLSVQHCIEVPTLNYPYRSLPHCIVVPTPKITTHTPDTVMFIEVPGPE